MPTEMATVIRRLHKLLAVLLRATFRTAPIAMIRMTRSIRARRKHATGLTTTATRM